MPEERKCIAVLMSKPERRYQSGILNGIYRAAFAKGFNVAIFGTGLPGGSEHCCDGEMNIFSLVNYEHICGAVYLPDTISFDSRDELVTKPLLKAVKEQGVCAVTIDYGIEGLPCYYCDDTDVIREMLRHLTEDHGCRDIAYMTGMKGHPHAERRLEIFKEFMAEHGLPIAEGRTYYGDFWYDAGEGVVEQLLGCEKLPDAIVCANAPMAESVYRALYNRGIRVPRDIKLAGYDEELENPSFIASTVRNTESIGTAACEGLLALLDGQSVKNENYVACEYRTNYSLTCGCSAAEDYDLLSIKQLNVDSLGDFFSEFNSISESLLSKKDLTEMLWTVDWYTYFMKDFTGIYLCMCDDWKDPENLFDGRAQIGFSPEMILSYYRFTDKNGELQKYVGTERRFKSKEIFPLLYSNQSDPAAYVFRALHFEGRRFGFVVLTYGDRLIVPENVFGNWLSCVANAIEAQRLLLNMRYLYKKMQENAITDMMTGLFNRNGFNLMLPQLLDEAKKGGYQTLLVMCDLNGLKYINDTFGHAEGDESIKTAAGALARTRIGGTAAEKNFRIGGDEFVKAAYGSFTNERLEGFRAALDGFLREYNASSGKPYPVYISLGFSLCGAGETSTADTMLFEADQKMYLDKIRVKKQTGFDPKRTG